MDVLEGPHARWLPLGRVGYASPRIAQMMMTLVEKDSELWRSSCRFYFGLRRTAFRDVSHRVHACHAAAAQHTLLT